MSRLVALTGGTGFLGRHAIRAFHEAGWRVRIIARRRPDLPELADAPFEAIRGDLADFPALKRVFEGVDAAVHIAGVVKAKDRAGFSAANVDGARLAARAAALVAPDAAYVHVSSLAARAPWLSDYAWSKAAGEAAMAEERAARDWVIARPAAIYGALDGESLKVLKLANAPVQVMLNAPDARVAMIDVRDAARALVALAGAPGGGRTYALTDARPEGYRWDDLVARAARALGRRPRRVRLSASLLRGLGALGGGGARLTGSAEMLTRGKVREILHPDWSADPATLPPADLWRPEIPLDQGLADMAAWAREAGRL